MTAPLLRTVSLFALLAAVSCAPPPETSMEPKPLTEKESNLLQVGLKVEKGGDVESAIGFYKQAMERSDGNVDGHLALSRVYLQQGKILQAEEVLQEAKAVQPINAEVNLRLGKIAIQRNQPQQAMGFFEDGLKELPGNVDLLNGKGVAYDMQARHEEAQLQYRQALAGAKTEYPFVENNLAMSYIMTGKYDEAIEVLSGIHEVGTSAVMRQNLALAYGLKGDMAKAREWGGKDLSEQEMVENIAFYQNYVEELQKEHEQAVPAPAVTSETLVPANVTSGVIPTTTEIQPIVPAAPKVTNTPLEKAVVAPAPALVKEETPAISTVSPQRTAIPVTPMEVRNAVPAPPTVISSEEEHQVNSMEPPKAEVVPSPVQEPVPTAPIVAPKIIPVAPVAAQPAENVVTAPEVIAPGPAPSAAAEPLTPSPPAPLEAAAPSSGTLLHETLQPAADTSVNIHKTFPSKQRPLPWMTE